VTDVPQTRLLADIASATGARWSRTASGYRLAYEPSDLRALWKRETAEYAKWIPAVLDELGERIERDGTMPAILARGKAAQAVITGSTNPGTLLGPQPRGAIRAAIGLGATRLADVRPGHRVVFSSRPNPRQRALPAGFDRVGLQFLQELEQFQTHLSAQYPSGGVRPRVPSTVGRTLVTVSRPLQTNDLVVRLLVESPDGAARSMGSVVLKRPEIVSPAETAGGELVPPSDETKRYGDRVSEAEQSKPDDRLAAIAAAADRTDPLELAFGRPLLALARAKRKGLVACLPDDGFAPAMARFRRPTPVGFVEAHAEPLGLRFESGDEIVVSPRFASTALVDRTDRTALARLARSLVEHGQFTFEAVADFADRTELAALRPLPRAWIKGYRPDLEYELTETDPFLSAPVIAALRALPRTAGNQEAEPVPLSAVPPPLRERLVRWVLEPVVVSEWSDYALPLESPEFAERSDLTLSTTEPGILSANMRVSDEIWFRRVSDGWTSHARAEALAPAIVGRGASLADALKAYTYRLGTQRQLRGTVLLNLVRPNGRTTQLSMTGAFSDNLPRAGSTFGEYGALPEPIRRQVEGGSRGR